MADSLHPELLSALLDGHLSPEQQASVEDHLQNHPGDAALLDDLKRLRTQLRGLPTLKAPANFQQKIMRRIHDSTPVFHPVVELRPSRSTSQVVLLVACAAALGALFMAGIFYGLNRNNTQLIARHEPENVAAQTDPTAEPSPAKEIAKSAEGAKLEEAGARRGAQPAVDDEAKSESDLASHVAPLPHLPVAGDRADQLPTKDLGDGLVLGESKENAANASAEGAGAGGQEDAAMQGIAQAKPESAPGDTPEGIKANGALANSQPMTVNGETCVRLDQLIFVQIPADQPAEQWIAAVFHQADVEMEADDGPSSFGEVLAQRDDDKKQDANDEQGQARSRIENQLAQGQQVAGEKTQPELSPAPEYLRPDPTTTAYWVDAEVRQIRTIMERLDGAVVVGFPNPGKWGPHGDARAIAKSFNANPAVARRLDQFAVPAKENAAAQAPEADRKQAAAEPTPSQQAFDALGLTHEPPTARFRLLFVFHATQSSAPQSDVRELKPAPNPK